MMRIRLGASWGSEGMKELEVGDALEYINEQARIIKYITLENRRVSVLSMQYTWSRLAGAGGFLQFVMERVDGTEATKT